MALLNFETASALIVFFVMVSTIRSKPHKNRPPFLNHTAALAASPAVTTPI